jgi:hypothetical protein
MLLLLHRFMAMWTSSALALATQLQQQHLIAAVQACLSVLLVLDMRHGFHPCQRSYLQQAAMAAAVQPPSATLVWWECSRLLQQQSAQLILRYSASQVQCCNQQTQQQLDWACLALQV